MDHNLMDHNLLVEIFVPTHGNSGHIATGYPVARNRVLTARHALFPMDRDSSAPIEARWFHQTPTARQWRTVKRVVWDGGETIDAAVIEVEFPEGVPDVGLLSHPKPVARSPWQSEGFARAGRKDDGSRRPVGMLGEVFGMADTASEFELGAKYAVELPAGWQGASGSPVFVGPLIIGVVKSCPQYFNAQRLLATPTWQLLGIAEFRDAINYQQADNRRDTFRRSIAKHLRKSPAAMDLLADVLEVQDFAKDDERRADSLAAALTEQPFEDALETIDRVHKEFCEQSHTPAADVCVIERLAGFVLPAVFDRAIVHDVHHSISSGRFALLSFPAATSTVTEIIMAAYDVRGTEFKPIGPEPSYPQSGLCLPLPPDCGIDADGNQFKKAFHDHLIMSHVSPDDRSRLGLEGLIRLAADRLQYLAAKRNRTYYFIFQLPDDTAKNQHGTELLRELKTNYPAIVFIKLTNEIDLIRHERQQTFPLLDILRRGGRAQSLE